jgi:hypothetical protein
MKVPKLKQVQKSLKTFVKPAIVKTIEQSSICGLSGVLDR